VYEQIYEGKAQDNWEPEEIAASLQLEEVCLQGKWGELCYSWPEHPARLSVRVLFDKFLEFQGVDFGED
jgi:hypothetical protein